MFRGMPKRDDYKIVEFDLPPLKDKEVLVKAEWLSVDPYLRGQTITSGVPCDQVGLQIGIVQESRNPKYPIGTRIVSYMGWCDYAILHESTGLLQELMYELPDLAGLPIEFGLGAVGMPGLTAYYGFLEICKPKPGETVVVTGAAGAIGSIVGQIAKMKGCKVIGFAGTDDKVLWLEEELGFDKALNYKSADISSALKLAAPNGVDCYFDNVGGEISSIIMSQMNVFGRVSVCGSISVYNCLPSDYPVATTIQPYIIFKQLRVEGFIVTRWFEPKELVIEAFDNLIKWIKDGKIKCRSHITEGFDNAVNAFVGMLSGENFGKAVVKV